MSQEIPKVYNPAEVEKKWYRFWEENGFFKPNEKSTQPPFTIVIPPPNITGSLHMGHALNNSIQDVVVRYKRMCGFKTLWLPGTDHAGIATQNVVERELKKEGKRKEDLGREKFLKRVWEWKREYGGKITQQLRRLGASCDWSRERFTMDEGLSKAVRRHFVQLYHEGLIYRGKRIINWCPRCKTALSDIEVEHETVKSSLWYIKYGPLTVATTRPETMLGDTAVAVNPRDERYKHMWGKTVELPLVSRHIPIIKDEFVDPSFGTGAVKVTPAHDPNDYEMGMRHNLPFVNILTPDGRITLSDFSEQEKEGIKDLEGLERFKGREEVVKMLKEKGYLVKIEDYETSIGHCYRCKTIVEPYLSDQWFVRVGPLAEKAIAAVEEGKIRFVPERWTKVYLQWMTNLKDWCISRQLWWGHQIPVWYRGEEIYVGEEPPQGEGWVQDPDVFDTWFSSALWPFSTLGWPDFVETSSGKPIKGSDLDIYYPTSVLVTGYDIITFWVSRMIMAGLHFMKEVPFKVVYVHGLVRDITGKKMSKSLGNVIDPVEVIDHVGADALRFALISLISGQGQDIKLSEEKITEARNFANKIWNASRFVFMNAEGKVSLEIPQDLSLAQKWILSCLNQTIEDITTLIEGFDFGQAARLLYDFIWSEFCDWFIEISKIDLYSDNKEKKDKTLRILFHVLEKILRLLHPFMPFISEEVWQILKTKTEDLAEFKSLIVASWPKVDRDLIDLAIKSDFEYLKALIISIRNAKACYGIQTKRVDLYLVPDQQEARIVKECEEFIKLLAKVDKVQIVSNAENLPRQSAAVTAFKTIGAIPLLGLIDFKQEIERLKEEKQKIDQELTRIQHLLENKEFLAKASAGVVENSKKKHEELFEKRKVILQQIKSLEEGVVE